MAKKEKDATASAKKEKVKEPKTKVKEPKKKEQKLKAPPDPAKTREFIRLLNLLALILAIAAFLLQLFAVLSHHWKWQTTDLRTIMASTSEPPSSSFGSDVLLDQHYGLFSREIKLLAKNDIQEHVIGSTKFPRIDDGEDNFHHCLAQTSTLRGAFLTCSSNFAAPDECHCRRYPYWNLVIVFEILALVLLGLVVVLAALLTTNLQDLLKFIAAGLALLAFLLLFIGLILILTHLKRETRSFADAYPHIYPRLANSVSGKQSGNERPHNVHAVRLPSRRRRGDIYRVYSLELGQFPHNETHFVEFSNSDNAWVYKPYASSAVNIPSPSMEPKAQGPVFGAQPDEAAPTQLHNSYGPMLGYDTVFETTKAGISWSTVLSILALILALLVALLLVLSALQAKSLGPKKPDAKANSSVEYELVPQEAPADAKTTLIIPVAYDTQRPVNEVVAAAQNVAQLPNVEVVPKAVNSTLESIDNQLNSPTALEIRNVVIPGAQTVANIVPENFVPVATETIQTIQRS